MNRVVHFEFPVDDVERAKKFYTEVFDWKISKWEGPINYWLIKTGEEGQPGIDGGMMMRERPSSSTVNTIEVSSVDDFTARISENGGKVVVPKMAIPGIGYAAYCQDTEGNVFSIMENDPAAK